MVNVNIICVGKIKEKYINMGIDEFNKRLSAYTRLKVIELKEDGNDKNRNQSMEKEAKQIIETISKNKGHSILMDIGGKKFSSEEMAKKIEQITVNGSSTINFIIGGSYGVTKEVRNVVDLRMSFSDLTFPHQLMRLILFEQVYRWFSILGNSKYHK